MAHLSAIDVVNCSVQVSERQDVPTISAVAVRFGVQEEDNPIQSYLGRAQVAFPAAGMGVRGMQSDKTAFVCKYGEGDVLAACPALMATIRGGKQFG